MLKEMVDNHGYTCSNFVKLVDDLHKLERPVKLLRRLLHTSLLV